MARDQFTFYRSFWDALRLIKNKGERLSLLEAVIAYALDEEERELSGTVASCFLLIKPTLDSSAKKAKSGKAGGSKKQTGSKPEANDKQTAREKEREKEVEVENEVENECYIPCSIEQEASAPARGASELPRKTYGQFVRLNFQEFCALQNLYGHTEFERRRKLVDLPENEGKDFYTLIQGVGEERK